MNRRRALIAGQGDGSITIYGSSLVWEQGYLAESNGTLNSTYTTWISSDYISVPENAYIDYTGPTEDENSVNWAVSVRRYDKNKTYLGYSAILSTSGTYAQRRTFDGCQYIRICFGHNASTGVDTSPSDGDLVVMVITPGATAKIPDAYQEVEYIENQSNSRFNQLGENYVVNVTDTVKIKAERSSVPSADQYVFGGKTGQGFYVSYLVFSATENQLSMRYDTTYARASLDGLYDYPVETTSHRKSSKLTITAKNSLGQNTATASKSGQYMMKNITIFSFWQSSSTYKNNFVGKLYSITVYNTNNVLRYNFVPCYRKSDSKVGLYESVCGFFMTNPSGTSDFIKGVDVI